MALFKKLIGLLLAVASQAALSAGYPLVTNAHQDEDGIWRVVTHNQGKAPVLVLVELKNQVNARSSSANAGGQKVLEPGARETMAIAIPSDPTQPIQFEYEVTWTFGRATNRGEHTGLYRTPFPGDMTFETINSAGDLHVGPRFSKAMDIVMPEGTPVIAARTGYVLDVRGEKGGDKVMTDNFPFWEVRTHERNGNYVRIMHDDGTWAEYHHLKDGSVRVSPGEKVEAGTEIALSGTSGVTNKPHLHFAVLKAQTGMTEPISVPVKMDLAGRGVVVVKVGEAIGASLSVKPDVQATRSDPLLIAPVGSSPTEMKRGVYAAAVKLAERVDWPRTWALIAAIFVLVSSAGLALILRMKPKDVRLLEYLTAALARKARTNATSAEEPPKDESHGAVLERPREGYLLTDEEDIVMSAVSLSMQIGYEVHCKVALHRLATRPIVARQNAVGFARLRGEAIDFAVVRQRDKKIVCAIDIKRENRSSSDDMFVQEMKALMLRRLGIQHLAIRVEAGPEEIRKLIKEFESVHTRHEATPEHLVTA